MMAQVHPVSAQGINSAVETAAVLVDVLKSRIGRLSEGEILSEEALESLFANFQGQRFSRTSCLACVPTMTLPATKPPSTDQALNPIPASCKPCRQCSCIR